ncbi:N-formylglutamate amidohydrolase [Epibacterium sp. SM1979]|uniref:N-formylglutamate amidohydrolase n=1 Tax=Tritonibacter litoralis TaxID=2662264 RepID=A0A843YK99_9RHOB|nr:N-formylglutamate amidohydrolase [Tritonibacter litoralis]
MSADSQSPDHTVEVINPTGAGDVVLLCEHASKFIPNKYNSLGLNAADRNSHAVWDPGARALSVLLSQVLDAPLIASTVSRLVYDCNRPPSAASAMPVKSELIEVPGNCNLTEAQRSERISSVYEPFQNAVQQVIQARKTNGIWTALVTIHSFTPIYFGQKRSVEIGILHDQDSRLADTMLSHATDTYKVERNSPYGPDDGVTHSLICHGVENALANVMIEVRNDLLAGPEDIKIIAEELLGQLRPALTNLKRQERPDA